MRGLAGVVARGSRGTWGGGGDSLKTEPDCATGPRSEDVQAAVPDREFLRKDQEFRAVATRYDKMDKSFAAA